MLDPQHKRNSAEKSWQVFCKMPKKALDAIPLSLCGRLVVGRNSMPDAVATSNLIMNS